MTLFCSTFHLERLERRKSSVVSLWRILDWYKIITGTCETISVLFSQLSISSQNTSKHKATLRPLLCAGIIIIFTILKDRSIPHTHLRNRGYCPTMYMMLEATMALLSFPLFCSHRPRSSLMTVTRNLFSSSSCMAPLIEPMAQHSCEGVCGLCEGVSRDVSSTLVDDPLWVGQVKGVCSGVLPC